MLPGSTGEQIKPALGIPERAFFVISLENFQLVMTFSGEFLPVGNDLPDGNDLNLN
jgi:hypothetical protein